MTIVWRKDPCYFEIGLEKEHRCMGHHLGPGSATTQNGAKLFGTILVTALCKSVLGDARNFYKIFFLSCSGVACCDWASRKSPAGC